MSTYKVSVFCEETRFATEFERKDLEKNTDFLEDHRNVIVVQVYDSHGFLEDIRHFSRAYELILHLKPEYDVTSAIKIIEGLTSVEELEIRGFPGTEEWEKLISAVSDRSYRSLSIKLGGTKMDMAIVAAKLGKMKSLRSFLYEYNNIGDVDYSRSAIDEKALLDAVEELPLLEDFTFNVPIELSTLRLLEDLVAKKNFTSLTLYHLGGFWVDGILKRLEGSRICRLSLNDFSLRLSDYGTVLKVLLRTCPMLSYLYLPLSWYKELASELENNLVLTTYLPFRGDKYREGYMEACSLLDRNNILRKSWSLDKYHLLPKLFQSLLRDMMTFYYSSPILIDIPPEVFQIILSFII